MKTKKPLTPINLGFYNRIPPPCTHATPAQLRISSTTTIIDLVVGHCVVDFIQQALGGGEVEDFVF